MKQYKEPEFSSAEEDEGIVSREGVQTRAIPSLDAATGKTVFRKGKEKYHEEFFRCVCHSIDHSLSFFFDEELGGDPNDMCDLYVEVSLSNYRSVWRRIWAATKYVFGYKCRYGHWDCWSLNPPDTVRLRALLETYESCQKVKMRGFGSE